MRWASLAAKGATRKPGGAPRRSAARSLLLLLSRISPLARLCGCASGTAAGWLRASWLLTPLGQAPKAAVPFPGVPHEAELCWQRCLGWKRREGSSAGFSSDGIQRAYTRMLHASAYAHTERQTPKSSQLAALPFPTAHVSAMLSPKARILWWCERLQRARCLTVHFNEAPS